MNARARYACLFHFIYFLTSVFVQVSGAYSREKETRGMDPEEERYMRIAQERMQKQRDRQRQEAQKRLEAQEKAQKEEERKRQGCDWSSVVLLNLSLV